MDRANDRFGDGGDVFGEAAASGLSDDENTIIARVEAAKAKFTGIDITDVPDDVLLEQILINPAHILPR